MEGQPVKQRIQVWLRWGWIPLATMVVWIALRMPYLAAPMYGDEAIHYYVSRHLWGHPTNILPAFTYTTPMFFQRPLFALLLAPGAMVSYEAYRGWHIVLTSLLPLLVWSLGARYQVSVWVRSAAILVLTLHPHMIEWSVLVFPDLLMMVLVLLAWRVHLDRPFVAPWIFVAAILVKETAVVAMFAFAAWEFLRAVRAREIGLYPLRLNRLATIYLLALLVAFTPMTIANRFLGGIATGWSTGGFAWPAVIASVGGVVVLLTLLVGLLVGGTREVAWYGLAFTGFYWVYVHLLGGGYSAWYRTAPLTMGVVAAMVVLPLLARMGLAWLQQRRNATTSRGPTASVGSLAVGLATLLIGLHLLAPFASATLPAYEERDRDALAAQFQQPDPLLAALDAIPDEDTVLIVDLGWFFQGIVSMHQANVGYGLTEHVRIPAVWADVIADVDHVLLDPHPHPMSIAIQEVWADCLVYENDRYRVYEGRACGDREAALEAAYERHVAPTTGNATEVTASA